MGLPYEDTPPDYTYIAGFILVMLLSLLNNITAKRIELRVVYPTIPHGVWNYFFLYFMK